MRKFESNYIAVWDRKRRPEAITKTGKNHLAWVKSILSHSMQRPEAINETEENHLAWVKSQTTNPRRNSINPAEDLYVIRPSSDDIKDKASASLATFWFRLARLLYEVTSEQLFKLADIFKTVFVFFVLLSSPDLTDYVCNLTPQLSPLFNGYQNARASSFVCDPLPSSLTNPCAYWPISKLNTSGDPFTTCNQIMEICSLQVDGVIFTWGVWFLCMFYEAFSTVYFLLAGASSEASEGEDVPSNTESSNTESSTSAAGSAAATPAAEVDEDDGVDQFVERRYYTLLAFFLSGCLIWSCYEYLHFVMLKSGFVCTLAQQMLVARFIYIFNMMMIFFVVNIHYTNLAKRALNKEILSLQRNMYTSINRSNPLAVFGESSFGFPVEAGYIDAPAAAPTPKIIFGSVNAYTVAE